MCRFETKPVFPEMKKLCVVCMLIIMSGMYSCKRHDAGSTGKDDAAKKDSIEIEKQRNDVLKAADSMNAPEKTKNDSSKHSK